MIFYYVRRLLCLSAFVAALLASSNAHAVVFEQVIEEDFNGNGPFGIGIDSDITTGLDNDGWVIDFIPNPDDGNLSTVDLNSTNQTLEVRVVHPETGGLGVANFARTVTGGVDPNGTGVQVEHFTVFNNFLMTKGNPLGNPIFTYDTANSGVGDGVTISLVETDDGSDGMWDVVILDRNFPIAGFPDFSPGTDIALGVQEFTDGTVNILYDEDTTDNGGVPEKKIHHTFTRFSSFISPADRLTAFSIIPNTNGLLNAIDYDIESTRIVVQREATDADFNFDEFVDGVDFFIWQQNNGTMDTGTFQTGDADVNGDIDGIDLGIWEVNYGVQPPPLSAASAVPEPTSGLLLLGALALVARCRLR